MKEINEEIIKGNEKIIVVALDIKRSFEDAEDFGLGIEKKTYDKWIYLSAKEKLETVINIINEKCQQLKKTDPKSLWIFTAKEYFITDSWSDKFLSHKDKKIIENKFQEIVKKYPLNLVLIPGTLFTKEESLKNPEKYKKYYDRYNKNIIDKPILFEKNIKNKFQHAKPHISFMENHRDNIKNIMKENEKDNMPVFYYQNTATIYTAKEIKKIQKKEPSRFELGQKLSSAHHILKPYKETKTDPFIVLQSPQGQKWLLGLEICFEYEHEILLRYHSDLMNQDNLPLIHLVISDTIALQNNQKQFATALIHIDSELENEIVYFKKDPGFKIELINYDILNHKFPNKQNQHKKIFNLLNSIKFYLNEPENFELQNIESNIKNFDIQKIISYLSLNKKSETKNDLLFQSIFSKKNMEELDKKWLFCNIEKFDYFLNTQKIIINHYLETNQNSKMIYGIEEIDLKNSKISDSVRTYLEIINKIDPEDLDTFDSAFNELMQLAQKNQDLFIKPPEWEQDYPSNRHPKKSCTIF